MLTPLRETRVSGTGLDMRDPHPASRKPLTQQRKAWADANPALMQLQLIINCTAAIFCTPLSILAGCLTPPRRKRLGAVQHQ